MTLKNPRFRFSALFLLLIAVYALWLAACWPGVLGQDSLASMLEVDSARQFQSGKPAFWYWYSRWVYGPWQLVEVLTGLQLVMCALICARVLSCLAEQRHLKSFAYALLFVALAPSVLYYVGSFYSDGIYAVALAGMLFEVWRCGQRRHIDWTSGFFLAITIPFAVFARPNGILNLAALVCLFLLLRGRSRAVLAVIALPWCLVAGYAQSTYQNRAPIGSVFPLALYESVGFMAKRPMGLWERNEPRVTDKTVRALTSSGATVQDLLNFHDPYYWDPLIFFADGPQLLSLSKASKKTIVREFFKYNIWHNFPAFSASRVNIFLYAFFADGDFPGLSYAKFIISKTESKSTYHRFLLPTNGYFLSWHEFTLKYRVIFWTPWVGLFLVVLACVRTVGHYRPELAIVALTYAAQLAAVFVFSIAGEYRYLLAFFTAPLVLLPVLAHRHDDSHV